MNISPVIILCVFCFLDLNDLARAAGACNIFRVVECDQAVLLDESKMGGIGSVGNRKQFIVSSLGEYLYPRQAWFSLNAIVKSPFLTSDGICFPELVMIEAHGLELRAEELLLLSKTSESVGNGSLDITNTFGTWTIFKRNFSFEAVFRRTFTSIRWYSFLLPFCKLCQRIRVCVWKTRITDMSLLTVDWWKTMRTTNHGVSRHA